MRWPWQAKAAANVRPRGPTRPAKERLDAQMAAFTDWARKNDTGLYKQIMLSRMGVVRGEQSEIDRYFEIKGKFDRMEQEGADTLNGLVKALPMVLGGLFGGGVQQPPRVVEQQPAQPQLQQPPQAPALPVAQAPEQPALPPGRKRRSSPHPNRIGPKRRAAMEAAQQQAATEAPAAMTVSQFIIQGTAGKQPEEAATWLLAQQEPLVQRIVPILAGTPEFALMHAVAKLRSQEGWADLVTYLEQNEEWSKAVVRALKERMKQPA